MSLSRTWVSAVIAVAIVAPSPIFGQSDAPAAGLSPETRQLLKRNKLKKLARRNPAEAIRILLDRDGYAETQFARFGGWPLWRVFRVPPPSNAERRPIGENVMSRPFPPRNRHA